MLENKSNKELWSKLYKNFENDICKKCRNEVLKEKGKISFPQPLPFIGSNYDKDRYKMMFIGVESWGNDEYNIRTKQKYEEFGTETVESHFKNGFSPFWIWMKDIASNVLNIDEDVLSHIAYSNLHKCQVRESGLDTSDYEYWPSVSKNCIQNAKWIYKEIKYLKPKNVIIFPSKKSENALAKHLLGSTNVNMINNFDFSRYDISNKDMEKAKYFPFIHLKEKNTKQRFIITIHPNVYGQYFPNNMKEIIKQRIIEIIRDDDWKDAISWEMPS